MPTVSERLLLIEARLDRIEQAGKETVVMKQFIISQAIQTLLLIAAMIGAVAAFARH